MTTGLPSVSVIIVSRGRPDALARCLAGITQLDHATMELIVVADAPGRAVVTQSGLEPWIKTVAFDEASIARARNLGIVVASGEICAFIDDDAVPEPSWLSHLTAPLADTHVGAAGGFVRGRNGISFQWRAQMVDRAGHRSPLEAGENRPSLHSAPPGRAIKTEGTNMAFRRELLLQMGGFDPAFRFYLDETDLDMRLSERNELVAVVPLAQVHHGFAASERRRADRVPRDLSHVGASTAIFLRKHAPEPRRTPALERLRADERRRALRHMVAGRLEPRDVRDLMQSLEAGISRGLSEPLYRPAPLTSEDRAFLPFPLSGPRPGRVIAGWSWQRKRLARAARAAAARGAIVTVFRFSPTTLYHHMRFHPDGYWEQRGGLFGRSERHQRLVRLMRFATRVREESLRLATLRPLDTLVT